MSEKKKSDSTELVEGVTDLNMEQIILGIAIMIILGFILNVLLVGLL